METTGSVPVDGSGERVPSARFHGVALVCNGNKDIHVGAETRQEAVDGIPGSFHEPPHVEYGDAVTPGRNAFTSNRHASEPGPDDANFLLTNATVPVSAEGNQWGHCSGTTCDVCKILAGDIFSTDLSVSPVALVEPGGDFDGPTADAPIVTRTTPARPRAGDVVRIYGDNFDAINGNPTRDSCPPKPADLTDPANLPACSPDGTCPAGPCLEGRCPCSIENRRVNDANTGNNPPNHIFSSRWLQVKL